MTFQPEVFMSLVAVALLAGVSGANDGSTILALSLPVRVVPPLVVLGLLLVAMAVVPLVFGMPIVSTLISGLVEFRDGSRPAHMAAAVLVAILVSGVSARRGLPTSLTLALVGALVGVGAGAGEDVQWGGVWIAVAIAAVAPIGAGALGFAASQFMRGASHAGAPARVLPALHVAGIVLQVVAYSANDGQKVLAVMLGSGLFVGGGAMFYGAFGALLVVFAIGALLGLRPVARRLARGVLPARALDALLAQAAASTAVLLSSAAGAPVSMTQSSAAALVGSGLGDGGHRIRWEAATRIVGAWLVTLPIAIALGAVAGLAMTGGGVP